MKNSTKLQTNNRVASYNRQDWPLRMLPAVNIFNMDGEEKNSDNAWLTGTIGFIFYFPAKLRRQDLTEVPLAIKGAMENFFASDYVKKMFDPHVSLYNPATVYGLNEYGKQLSWTPNVEAILENQNVPATMIKARYRIDLRAWYRALEQQLRTKGDPFDKTLGVLEQYLGNILGVDDNDEIKVEVPLTVDTVNP